MLKVGAFVRVQMIGVKMGLHLVHSYICSTCSRGLQSDMCQLLYFITQSCGHQPLKNMVLQRFYYVHLYLLGP